MDAAQLQHLISYGVVHDLMRRRSAKKISTLADALDVQYDRLQKMLSGRAVMQLEDIGRLRVYFGDGLDTWMVRGAGAELFRTFIAEGYRPGTRLRAEHMPARRP